MFYKEKIENILYSQMDLINDFVNNINNIYDKEQNSEKHFIGFLVGYYKLFIYITNYFNHTIKKYAKDYYIKINNQQNLTKDYLNFIKNELIDQNNF